MDIVDVYSAQRSFVRKLSSQHGTSREHRNAGSAIDASLQSGTNGTVTINGVIQP
jgi:hypothetical protein